MVEHDVVLDIRSGPTRREARLRRRGDRRPDRTRRDPRRHQARSDRRIRCDRSSPHAPSGPAPRRDTQRFEDLREGSFVVHHQHGVARFGGMVTRAIGGNERDYLLLEYRGGDKLYVLSDQIESVRHYTGGIRRACRGWEAPTGVRPRPRSVRRCRRSPRSSSCSIRNARAAATPLRPTPLAGRVRGVVPVPGNHRPTQRDHRREERHGTRVADGSPRRR